MARRTATLTAVVVILSLLVPAAIAAAPTEITAPTVDEPTTIVDDPAQVPGLERDCGCKPWWYWALLAAGGIVLLVAFYAAWRAWRGS